jgi:hypothetical protein
MSEKINVSTESGQENRVGVGEASHESALKRGEAAELARKKLGETNISELSSAAKEKAISGAEKPRNDEGAAQAAHNTHSVHPFIHHAPATVLKHVRTQLPTFERQFSKVIHNNTIEKISDLAGDTVARPSGILGGAIVALIGVSFMNYNARKGGFRLSGGEFVSFMLIGWILGVILEKLWRKIKQT